MKKRGQLRKGEGRGNHSSHSVTTPEGENTGYTRSSVILGAGAGAGAALGSRSGSDLPPSHSPLGWAIEAPPRGHQGFLALLIIPSL